MEFATEMRLARVELLVISAQSETPAREAGLLASDFLPRFFRVDLWLLKKVEPGSTRKNPERKRGHRPFRARDLGLVERIFLEIDTAVPHSGQ